jgi:hypothetical protein
MKVLKICASLVLLFLSMAVVVDGKSWNGVTPLKTSRAEVIGILGYPDRVDAYGRAVFETNGETVLISWVLPNCYAGHERVADWFAEMSALVFHITVKPKARRELSEVQKVDGQNDPPEIGGKDPKVLLKETYKRWLSTDVDCLLGADDMSCSQSNSTTGFGYSHTTKAAVTAIYYYPTSSEIDEFSAARPACADVEKKAPFW